ncbi:ABC transporter permease [Tistrella bauzanensis]|uniref:ABC transporter permease n=1 Tax=Tistrella bauzanensis TaxID=657419 RepID=A0ABQ1IAX3_9PROT|nr:ABC transporter permease [Tistrella bauzanensis]
MTVTIDPHTAASATIRSRARRLLALAADNPPGFLALLVVALMVFAAVFGPAIVPHDPLATNVAHGLEAPSPSHWFGTDQLGRDIFSRVVVATRLDLAIAISAVALSCVAGTAIGALCGWRGGWLDRGIGRLVDVLMAFPLFVVAMAMVAALGNTVANIVWATAIINLPFYIRVTRAEVAARRDAAWVQAARLGGYGDMRLLFTVLLPALLPVLAIQVSLNLGWAVLNAAGLSFIGLGVRPPAAEWGILTSEGAQFIMTGQWWVAVFPGLALLMAVFAFNLAGDALRDLLDPRRR